MTLPKFIITLDGVFRLGMVNQHKHLLSASGPVGPTMMSGTCAVWSELQ
jgi:hypothetical protein